MTVTLTHKSVEWANLNGALSILPHTTYIFSIATAAGYQAIKKDYQLVLSAEEINKSTRFRHQERREQFITARYFLRQLLSKCLSIPPARLNFHDLENRKPAIEGIEFNISHSGDYILIAISEYPVGIDVERIDRNFDHKSVLNSSFSKDEISFIHGPQEVLNFYTLWTRKESLLKASGEGLTDELDQVPSLQDQVKRGSSSYRLSSFKMDENHVASIAVDQRNQDMAYFRLDFSQAAL